MKDFKRYGIEVGQVYKRADGAAEKVVVLDTEKFAHKGDVLVALADDKASVYRIDCFKLAMTRYELDV